jgi:hypothetical protein
MKEGFLGVLKFFLFLLILPTVIAAVLSFQGVVLGLPVVKEQWFLWGVAIFVITYLFLYDFKHIYDFGHMGVANLFKGLGPSSHFIAFILPIYTLIIVTMYFILKLATNGSQYEGPLTVILGFSVAMHVVLTAHQLYEADSTPLKSQYLVCFAAALVVNLIVISLLLGVAIPEFSFMTFLKGFWNKTAYYYQMIYRVLFISPS